MGAGQAQVLPQELHEQRPRIDIRRRRAAVYRHRDMNHSDILLNQDFFGAGAQGRLGLDHRDCLEAPPDRPAPTWRNAGRRRGCEIGEKFVGHILGDAVDETRAELGDLASDRRLDVVAQQRAAWRVGERNLGAALGEAGDAALALALDGVAHERDDVGELDFAFERGGDRSDLGFDDGGETVLAGLLQRFATREWQDLRTSGSFSSVQTFGLSAGNVTSPVIVMAMNVSFLRGLDRSATGSGSASNCTRQHFATREKYQDAAMLSAENGRRRSLLIGLLFQATSLQTREIFCQILR